MYNQNKPLHELKLVYALGMQVYSLSDFEAVLKNLNNFQLYDQVTTQLLAMELTVYEALLQKSTSSNKALHVSIVWCLEEKK